MAENKQKSIAWIGSGKNYQSIMDILSSTRDVTLEHFPDTASFFAFSKKRYDLYIPEASIRSGSMQLPERVYQGQEDKIALFVIKEIRRRDWTNLIAVPHHGISENHHKLINDAGANIVINLFTNSDSFFINLALRSLRDDYSCPIPSD